MTLITGRQVWFYEDNIGPLRFGIIERASSLGRLMVRVTDGLDSLREIGIEPEQQVFYTEELAISCKKSYQFVKPGGGAMNTASQELDDLRDKLNWAYQVERDAETNLAAAQQNLDAARKEVAEIQAKIEQAEREIGQ